MTGDRVPSNPSPVFHVGDAFPANKRTAQLLRFWMTTRYALAIGRSMVGPPAGEMPEEVEVENGTFLILANAAIAQESCIAFRDARLLGCFDGLPFDRLDGMREKHRLAVSESDDSDVNSLHSLLNKVRNNAGAHWSPKYILRGLRRLENETIAAMVGGPSHFEGGRPLAGLLIHEVLERCGVELEQVPKLFPRIQALTHAFRDVADFAVGACIAPVSRSHSEAEAE